MMRKTAGRTNLPAPDLGYTAAMDRDSEARLRRARDIASQFRLPGPAKVRDFPEKGNINQQTYLVEADSTQYLLQQLNPDVFKQPRAVMEGMISCIRAQNQALLEGRIGRDDEWEPIRLVPARDGRQYLETPRESGSECWRMMVRIGGARAFQSLREIPDKGMRVSVAEETGRGLALFGVLTSGMDTSLITCPLPGYRDTELYYNQLLAALAGARSISEAGPYLPSDPTVRESNESHFLVRIDPPEYKRRLEDRQLRPFIDTALQNRAFGLTLSRKLKSGELKRTVVHGDTKLDNFLFSTRTGRVKALVDLDTIMQHTWLSDWGDMVRSLVNVAGEKEPDLGRIEVDEDVYKALLRGFLRSASHARSSEIELMEDAPRIMALELGVRFLADYLRGDTYFRPAPGEARDLNKIRAMVQFRIFEQLENRGRLPRLPIMGSR